MPKFGPHSRARLATCDTRLQELCCRALLVGMDFSVLVGHRGEVAQNAAYDAGLSKVRWPNSKHNKVPSLAVDVAPYPIDWEQPFRFYHLAGVFRSIAFEMGLVVRWGGDWDGDWVLNDETFFDLGHFELPT